MATQKTARETYYAMDAMRQLEWDIYNQVDIYGAVPPQWGEIADRKSVATEKITIRIDEDVLKFMRSLGPGYQTRVNRVLRGFMHCKLGALMNGPASVQAYMDDKDGQPQRRPKWGEFGKFME